MKRKLLRSARWHTRSDADAALSEKGHEEAIAAGKLSKEAGFKFDAAYVSVLKRAIVTLW